MLTCSSQPLLFLVFVELPSSAGNTAWTGGACAGRRRGCGSCASSTASSRDRRLPPFFIHPRLAPGAAFLRSCGAGFTFSGGLRWEGADCDLGDAFCCGAGCGVLKLGGGIAAGDDATAAGVGTLAALAGRMLRLRSAQASASVPTLALGLACAGRAKAPVPTRSLAMAAVPTWACSAALRAWASRARTRVPSAWYSQKWLSWGSTGL